MLVKKAINKSVFSGLQSQLLFYINKFVSGVEESIGDIHRYYILNMCNTLCL